MGTLGDGALCEGAYAVHDKMAAISKKQQGHHMSSRHIDASAAFFALPKLQKELVIAGRGF